MSERSKRMLFVGFCRLCGTGPLGLRRCGQCHEIVVLCDECDAVWTDADFSRNPVLTTDPALPCPTCSASLVELPSTWAKRHEVDSCEWLATALRGGVVELQEGEPFAPEGPEPTDEPLDAGG